MAKALIPLVDGVEEMEAVIVADVLRRAGWTAILAGLKPGVVVASRGVRIQPDAVWEDVDLAACDALMIPGGKGAWTLASDPRVLDTVRRFRSDGKWIGAICAAPLVLQAAGILEGARVTSHPSVAGELRIPRQPERVVVDGRIITSQGPGTAFEFALTLVRLVDGPLAAERVAGPMML